MPSSLEKTVKSSGINCIKTRITICCLIRAQGERHRRECVNKRIHKTLLDMEFQMKIYVRRVCRMKKKHSAHKNAFHLCQYNSHTFLRQFWLGKVFELQCWDVKCKPIQLNSVFSPNCNRKVLTIYHKSGSSRLVRNCKWLPQTIFSWIGNSQSASSLSRFIFVARPEQK